MLVGERALLCMMTVATSYRSGLRMPEHQRKSVLDVDVGERGVQATMMQCNTPVDPESSKLEAIVAEPLQGYRRVRAELPFSSKQRSTLSCKDVL